MIANGGVFDFGAANLGAVPAAHRGPLIAALRAGPSAELDRIFAAAMARSPVARWSFTHGIWCFGASGPSDYLHKTLDYALTGGIAEQIRCPTLVCDAENDLFFKGQPQMLYDHLTCRKTLMRFTDAEGAGAHCAVGAARLANARIFDWLDEVFYGHGARLRNAPSGPGV